MVDYVRNIKKIRENKGISQEYMAMELGISQSTYTKIERGEVNLYVNRLLKIAKILDVGLSKIFDENVANSFNVNTYDSSTNYNQVVENLHNDNKEIVNKFQAMVEAENMHLKEEISFLRQLIAEKR